MSDPILGSPSLTGGASPSTPASPAGDPQLPASSPPSAIAAATPESPEAVAMRLLGPLAYLDSAGPGLDVVAVSLADGGAIWASAWTTGDGVLDVVRYTSPDNGTDYPGEVEECGWRQCAPSGIVEAVLLLALGGEDAHAAMPVEAPAWTRRPARIHRESRA